METILRMSFPVIQKGENIPTQSITTSAFGASVKGEKNESFENLVGKNTSYF